MQVLSGFKVPVIRRWLLSARAMMYTRTGVLVCAAPLWIGMAGLLTTMLLVSRQDAYDRAVQDSRNIALVLERDILRSVEFYDLSLRAVTEGAENTRIMSLPEDLRGEILFDRAAMAKYLGPITVFGPDGTTLVCSIPTCPPRPHRPDVRSYVEHTEKTDTGLYISHPYVSHTAGEAWSSH